VFECADVVVKPSHFCLRSPVPPRSLVGLLDLSARHIYTYSVVGLTGSIAPARQTVQAQAARHYSGASVSPVRTVFCPEYGRERQRSSERKWP